MGEITTIGLHLAKLVFQAHGANRSGSVVFRKTLRRHKVLAFMAGADAPRMLVITALANKMARTVWALMAKNEIYRAPVVSKTTNKFSPEVRERAVRRSACSRRSVAAGKAERGRDTPPSATA